MTSEFVEPVIIIAYESEKDARSAKTVRIREPSFILNRNRTSSPILSRPLSPNYPEIPIEPVIRIKSQKHEKSILDLYEKYSTKKDYGIENPLIFEEKGNYNVNSKVDSLNINYVRPIGNITIFDEKININASPKIDSLNKNYTRSGGNVEIFNEKIKINATPRIIASNENYTRGGGNVVIFNEKIKINAQSKIDANNSEYKPSGKTIEVNLIINKRILDLIMSITRYLMKKLK